MKCLLSLVLMASVAFAHGGVYVGPAGGGTPGVSVPVGGGTGPGQPNPNNPNPVGGGVGGVTGLPAGTGQTPNTGGGAPVRPGVGSPVGGVGGRGFGGTTPRGKKGKNPYLDWSWWWDLNDDRFLLLKKKIRTEESRSRDGDTFLGGIDSEGDIAGVTAKKIRESIVPAIILALKDSYYDTRAAAAIALGKIAPSNDLEALARIADLLKDNSKQVREAACLGIGLLGNPEGVQILREVYANTGVGKKFLGRSNDILTRTRSFALVGMGLIGSRGVSDELKLPEYLVGVVKNKQATKDNRVAAAVALQLIKDTGFSSQLQEVFDDTATDPYVRAHVGIALGKVKAWYTNRSLLKSLSDKNSHVSRSAAIALGMIGSPKDKKLITTMRRAASSGPNRGTRNFSLISLGEIGSPEGMKSLVDRFTKGTEMDKSFAALAIGIYGFNNKFEDLENKRFISDLLHKEYIKVKSPSLKGAYGISLGLLKYEEAAEDMRKDLDKVHSQITQGHLAIALALLDNQDSIPAIRELVKRKGEPDRRKLASMALGMLRDKNAVNLLKDVIKESSSSKAILAAATVSLGHIGDRSAVDTLVDIATGNKYADLSRAFAVVALGYLGDKDDIPLLSKIHYNSNYLAQTESLAELLTIL